MACCILIASGKGGTGKTTLAAALGCALQARGERVLCIDLDAGMGTLELCLCMHDASLFSVAEVLDGRVELSLAAAPVHGREGLRLLCAPPAGYVPDGNALAQLCRSCTQAGEYVILDVGAGLPPALSAARQAAELGLVVSLAEPGSLRDAACTAALLSEKQGISLRLVCNRIPQSVREQKRRGINVDALMDGTGLPLGAVVYEDAGVLRAAARSGLACDVRRSAAIRQVGELAERIRSNIFLF